MKKPFLLIAFIFGVLVVGCENLLPNEQTPTPNHVFVTDSEGAYILEAEGGEVVVTIATNVDYSIVIPEEAQAWLSVADTRAEARMEKQTFIIAENETFEERSANVELVDNTGEVLQTISFIQCAAALPDSSCPSNEIWYTNGSTTERIYSNNPDAFGVNIISNTFDAEKACWIIKFDGDVTTIESNAFSWCEGLTSVTIGDSVTTIGDNAFYNCSSLTSVAIGDSVTKIGDYAFNGCSSLTSVTIPDSVTTIGEGAFDCCSSLTEFNGKFASEDGRCLIIDGTLNSFAPAGLTEYTIPDSVTTIGRQAFYLCSSLTSVTIPDSVTTIGDYAFSYCSSLTSITIPDSVTTIGGYAFLGCSSLTSVTIPDSVTTIGTWAFAHCSSLTSVTIPDSVTSIGAQAFSGCSSLTSVTIGDGVTTIGTWTFYGCSSLREFNGKFASEDGRCLIIDGTLNSFAPAGLTEYTIPDSVTTIGERVFYNCSSLTSVTIPDSVTTIGDCAFEYCSNLTSVTIPDSVTTIGVGAFLDCCSLTSVTIGDGVTTIGTWAFENCSSLTSVYCKATTPPAGGSDMFYGNASGRKIYVPTESVEAYKSAEWWSEYASDIVGYDF